MIGQSNIPGENYNEESNAKVRKDWQKIKNRPLSFPYQARFSTF